jgi:hypothetical protein
MPRFNSDKYNTAQDSSPGWKTYKPEHVVLLLAATGPTSDAKFGCPCGCGGWPLGEKATFAMGHDARLRGILIRAHLMGKKIFYVLRTADKVIDTEPLDALTVAKKHAWGGYLEQAVLKREGKNREVLSRAMGSQRLIQVGRWEYTGQVCAVYRDERNQDMVEVEYVNAAGDVKRARMPLEEAVPA